VPAVTERVEELERVCAVGQEDRLCVGVVVVVRAERSFAVDAPGDLVAPICDDDLHLDERAAPKVTTTGVKFGGATIAFWIDRLQYSGAGSVCAGKHLEVATVPAVAVAVEEVERVRARWQRHGVPVVTVVVVRAESRATIDIPGDLAAPICGLNVHSDVDGVAAAAATVAPCGERETYFATIP